MLSLDSNPATLRRLGLNHGGYHGETVDMASLVRTIVREAQALGWKLEELSFGAGELLPALHWRPDQVERRFYFSTGMHGDEPAGPLAIQALISGNHFPSDAECWVLPCLNPSGFALNQRENRDGLDLNRDFLNPKTPEVKALTTWLRDKGRFDCAVCLHEDWESQGFYIYAVNPRRLPCLSESIIEAVKPVFPIDPSSEIEGLPAVQGVITPPANPLGRDIWPETLYLTQHHTDLGYTFETSSDYPLDSRIHAHVVAVRALLDRIPKSSL